MRKKPLQLFTYFYMGASHTSHPAHTSPLPILSHTVGGILMGRAMEPFKEHLAELHDLTCAERVLGWDQQTYMPPGGGAQRADHISTLNRLIHSKFISEETLRLLEEAESETESLPDDHDDRCL